MRASACDHCTRLAIAREIGVPGVAELIAGFEVTDIGLPGVYGDRFEAALEGELRASLGSDFQRPEGVDLFESTIELMRAGVPVIYQGGLQHQVGPAVFSGKPDFLVRGDFDLAFHDGLLTAVHVPSRPNAGYIAWDAKLASSAKPNYLLQLALYVDALEQAGLKAQQVQHGLILGSRQLVTFEEGEIVPAMQQARAALIAMFGQADGANARSEFALDTLSLACDSTDACKICEYPDLCAQTRIQQDQLVQVAGINRSQIEKLKRVGIATMAQLAEADDSARPSDFVPGSFDKLRNQARLQHNAKVAGKHDYLILNDPEIGVLPPASAGDLFFDMEGFPYFEERGGLEYLFGAVDRDRKFHAFWAHDRSEERMAFESFVDFAVAAMKADPKAHIYHYAPYELTALNRLAARHSTRELEVAWLIEDDRLVDLYKVVRGSIMVSQPSYSIKYLEVFYGVQREGEVTNAGSSIEFYEEFRQTRAADSAVAQDLLQKIADYNTDDCVSTLELYEWLSSMPGAHSKFASFRQAVAAKKELERRQSDSRDDSPGSRRALRAEAELERLNQSTQSLKAALEDWPWGQSESGDYQAKIWLALTHSMLYYNREEVIQWRDWRLRRDATFDALDRDRKALVVEGAAAIAEPTLFGLASDAKLKIEYSYHLAPGQTNFLKTGDAIFVRYNTGANQQDTDYGSVKEVHGDRLIFVRNTTVAVASFEPNAIFANEWMPLADKPNAVADWVTQATSEWGTPASPVPATHPLFDLLMRRVPKLKGGRSLPKIDGPDALPAVLAAVDHLDRTTLAIQGPPGAGKTYLASRAIAHLVAQGKRIGITANSHSAIENLLTACLEAGVDGSQIAKRNQTGSSAAKPWRVPKTNSDLGGWLLSQGQSGCIIGGTSWNFASAALRNQPFDYLFIDEAAQFSLVDAICAGSNSNNIVLLGDPQQLTQVVQAVHPGGVDNSALGHYMGDQQIIAESNGFFIDTTRRMHAAVNEPVSWLSYQGMLHAHESTATNRIDSVDPGLISVPVEHFGNASHSIEEAHVVLDLVREHSAKLDQSQILVVAPYNAQVDLIRDTLDSAGFDLVQVGTVDKFQGREAMVVIVSLAASSAADAPRGLEFLLDRNRLNVAISRAKANCYLVFNPALTRTRYATVTDVKSVSRLVGLLGFAHA
jgi:uncharacterized protein